MIPFGVLDKLTKMAPSVSKTLLADVGKRLAVAGGAITAQHFTEALTEGVNQVVGNIADKYAQGKDISLTKGVADAMILGGVTGNLMGAPHAVRTLSNSRLEGTDDRVRQQLCPVA